MNDRDKVYLLKELTRTIDKSDSTAAFCLCQRWILKDALALLKEQEEPKPGHWIAVESHTGVEAFGIKEMAVQTVRCSVCGTEEDVSFSAYRFCPKCGTKMEGR